MRRLVAAFARTRVRTVAALGEMRAIAQSLATLATTAAALFTAAPAFTAEPLVLDGAIVTLIEQVDVPARALGPLAQWNVREGDVVERGQSLGKIDDAEAKLASERAAIEAAVAQREAQNELPILAAAKAAEAAEAELKRAVESVAKFEKSVSETELDRLKLAAEEGLLKRRQAEHVRASAGLTADAKENEAATARHRLELHHILAPTAGVVVEIKRRVGEWVEPGLPVLRLVRMDRLRVEAFCDVAALPKGLVGRAVQLRVAGPDVGEGGGSAVTYEGRIAFVHPEVNPVNNQVRIWAEVDNLSGTLHPGQSGKLTIP